MALTEIKLPLWALAKSDPHGLAQRIKWFLADQGHLPDENSTLMQWVQVHGGGLAVKAELVATAMTRAYTWPDRRQDLLRVVVRTAYLAARREHARTPPDVAKSDAMALVEEWLDHGQTWSRYDTNFERARRGMAGAAAEAAHWAVRATWADCGSCGSWDGEYYEACASAAGLDIQGPNLEPDAWRVELAQRNADFDRLLLELNLEGPCPKP